MEDTRRENKLKTTSTGSSKNITVNDIGNPYLHKRNKVGITRIEKSKYGRAIVYDQHTIDSLFLKDQLTIQQHNACDKYLGMIHASGTFVSSSAGRLDQIFTDQYSHPLPRCVILIKVQKVLKREAGLHGEKVFWKIMVDSPKTINDLQLELVKECSDVLLNYWYVSMDSPVSLFQQAIANPV